MNDAVDEDDDDDDDDDVVVVVVVVAVVTICRPSSHAVFLLRIGGKPHKSARHIVESICGNGFAFTYLKITIMTTTTTTINNYYYYNLQSIYKQTVENITI
jgi:hypothetical protein